MSPTIRVTSDLYSRLERHAVGFDSPSNVIERLLHHYESTTLSPENQNREASVKAPSQNEEKRIFKNKEIQKKISMIAKGLPDEALNQLCELDYSKKEFGISFPLFVRVPAESNQMKKRAEVKSPDGVPRWTWKYEFERSGYLYAVCTQWYGKHDEKVLEWLKRHE